jgi:thioredoxin-like negative regulator of GroEL
MGVIGFALALELAGVIKARGVAAADLRAPSADIARVRAERSARERAAQKLAAAIAKQRRDLDDAARKQLVDAAETVEVRYESDGSVAVELRCTPPAKGGR